MKKPNLLFILEDHQLFYRHGWDFGPKIKRPFYEAFAREGVEFTNCYSGNPLCGPTRRSILTGQYSHRHGEVYNDMNIPFTDRTYLQILKEDGYRNYYYGKWHAGPGCAYDHGCEGVNYPSYGNIYLTEEYKDYCRRKNLPHPEIELEVSVCAWMQHIPMGPGYKQEFGWTNEHASGVMLTPKETHEAFFLADQACEKLEEIAASGSDEPFALRVDFWGPHQPYFPTREYADMYPPEDIPEYPSFDSDLSEKPAIFRKDKNLIISDENENIIYPNPLPKRDWQLMMSRAYAQGTMVDEAAGLILKKLKELGLDENTLVIWTADHGDALGCHGGHFDKCCYMCEEELRIPLAMSYPGHVAPNQVTDAVVSNIDVPVTLLDAAGLKFDYEPDGKSLLALESSGFKNRRPYFVSETYGHHYTTVSKVLVNERYKYTYTKDDIATFYDLATDPYEQHNRMDDPKYADKVREAQENLRKWVSKEEPEFFELDRATMRDRFWAKAANPPHWEQKLVP